jgi:GNAT superfamily N-acetyltransferase
VGQPELTDLARLFESQRNTRHCWCMAFCQTRGQFAAGWLTGRNRRRFEALATSGPVPMGILASMAGEPIGGRRRIMRHRATDEDESVWLLACLFVRDGYRGQGVTYALVGAAVELARREGAVAIEGWPSSGSARHAADAFLGREKVFEDLGFSCVGRPSPQRAIMRRQLDED